MASITSPVHWDERELAGLQANYDLGSGLGDAVTKYNPAPGDQKQLGDKARGRTIRNKLPLPRHPVQAADALATRQCPPTTIPSTMMTRSTCR